jgi:hypothetical protein
MSDAHELRMFVTVEGREVTVRPVAQYLVEKVAGAIESRLRASGLPLNAPVYTATTASGAVETYPHTESTLTTDEDKAAWAKHLAAVAQLGVEANAATMRLYLLRGLDVGDPPQAWIDDMKALGVTLPPAADDVRLEYIQCEVLKTTEDVLRAYMAIVRLSAMGVDPASLDAAEASFRRTIQGAGAPVNQPASG